MSQQQICKILNGKIKKLNPEDALVEMVESLEGTVFVLGSRHVNTEGEPDDSSEVEVTIATINKIRTK